MLGPERRTVRPQQAVVACVVSYSLYSEFFPFDMDKGVRWHISYELFQAYQKQKKVDKEYAKYHYKIEIDVEFAKQYLYKNLIEQYAIIDRLVEVSVKDDEINIKYDMDNKIKETKFDGGFDLLREWKLKDYK